MMMGSEIRIDGSAKTLGGVVEEAPGALTGDVGMQEHGSNDPVKKGARKTLKWLIDIANSWSLAITDAAKERPLTALLVALAAGSMLRMLTHSRRDS
jgi:hypothetical protein